MEPLGLDFGPPGEVKTLIFAATVVKIQGFRVFLKGFKKEAQKVPKGDPREAKMPPGSAPGAPRSGQDRPRSRQERPRRAPRADQEAKKRNKKGVHFPGGPWEPPWSDFRAFLEPPGWHFGAIFERFFFV